MENNNKLTLDGASESEFGRAKQVEKNETLTEKERALISAYMSMLGKKSHEARALKYGASEHARKMVNARWKKYRENLSHPFLLHLLL